MKSIFFLLIGLFVLPAKNVGAQGKPNDMDHIMKSIHQILSEFKQPKDSLLIYAFNFELSVAKMDGRNKVSKIKANDSLAYTLFPLYEKLKTVDYSVLMKNKTSARIVIPILMYGSSEAQKKYKDENGNVLINFKAALNAMVSLYDVGARYNNENDALKVVNRETDGTNLFTEAIFMRPFLIELLNMK